MPCLALKPSSDIFHAHKILFNYLFLFSHLFLFSLSRHSAASTSKKLHSRFFFGRTRTSNVSVRIAAHTLHHFHSILDDQKNNTKTPIAIIHNKMRKVTKTHEAERDVESTGWRHSTTTTTKREEKKNHATTQHRVQVILSAHGERILCIRKMHL